jgi:hypothetical protein
VFLFLFDSVRCDNGVTLRVVSYILFLGFLSGPTKQILQRQKHGHVLVMCLVSANVAKTEIWSVL